MIFWGYFSILMTLALLIVLTEKILCKIVSAEYCRKTLHIGTLAALPLANKFLGKGSIHFVVICAIFTVVSLLLYSFNKLKTVDERKKRYPGIFYYALSLLFLSIVCCLNKQMSDYFSVAFISLAIGDGFATLVGHTVGGIKIYKDKTLSGFLACFTAMFFALLVYSELNQRFIDIKHVMLLSVLVSIVELVDLGLDNIVIPVVLFFASFWVVNYETAFISLLIFEAIFLIAFFLKVIEYYGAMLAALMGMLFYYFYGLYALLFVIGCYAVMLSVSLVSKLLKNNVSGVVKKTGKKDITEIFVNGIWSLLAILLFAIFKNKIFFVITLVAMSEGFVDSLASDVGTLSKQNPYDFIHRKTVPKGLSGGITVMGCTASFIGAIVFSTAIKFVCDIPYYMIFLLTLIIYFGAVIDSVLGSLLQAKYQCTVCSELTEREEHCNKETQLIGGFKYINNDTVNMLSGMFVFLFSFILFVFL